MNVLAHLARAGLAELSKRVSQLSEQIRLGRKMAERQITCGLLLLHLFTHRHPVVAMHRIALQNLRLDPFAAEDVLKAFHDRRGART